MGQIRTMIASTLMLALANGATADRLDAPDRVSVLLGAHHLGADGFEEFTPGVFLTWDNRLEYSVGVFSNSYGDFSAAFSAGYPIAEWENGAVHAFGGLAYYENAEDVSDFTVGDIVPLAGIQLRQGRVFTQLIPMDGTPVDAIITLGITIPTN